MSYIDGWSALNLEMPARVPRTEYSAEMHWSLLSAVTGIEVRFDSPDDVKSTASLAFRKAWNYSLAWSTLIGGGEFGELRTRMGHAEYMEAGQDWDPVVECPFTDPEQVLEFDPFEAFGEPDIRSLRKRFEDSYSANCAALPDEVNMTGVYTTCVSGLIDLFGWEMLLLAMGTDPVRMGEATDRYCRWMGFYFQALAEASVPVVMVHDDIVWSSGAIFDPAWYRRYVFPNYRKMWQPVVDSGKILLFTSDGNYTAFVDDIAACGAKGFVMEPMTDMAYVAERYGRTHAFIGNADTRILLNGTREAIRAEVERCMAIGKSCPGFFMAVGNHIPPNTPVDSALYYNEVVEELSRR